MNGLKCLTEGSRLHCIASGEWKRAEEAFKKGCSQVDILEEGSKKLDKMCN